MAKAFYSMEEVCELLGKSADDIRAMVREGALREFRDAGKVFFKAEDIERLSGGSAGGGDEVALEPAEGEELPTLADSGGGTSIIGLEPVSGEEKSADKEGTVITASGIGVFDEDELEIDADPMADTQITAGAIGDQVSLEGTGSGSGLLDLTREADDTSLGAELLDEIYPGEEEGAEAPAASAAEPEEEAEEAAEPALEAAAAAEAGEVVMPAYAVAADPSEGLFSGLLAGALILLTLAGSVVAGVLQGYLPDYAQFLSNNFLYFLLGAVLVPILSLLIGWVIGRAAVPRRA